MIGLLVCWCAGAALHARNTSVPSVANTESHSCHYSAVAVDWAYFRKVDKSNPLFHNMEEV
jgi:hypothetical protein